MHAPHRIGALHIGLTFESGAARAEPMANEALLALVRGLLLPAIERALDEAGGPDGGRVRRIERLDVDLGEIAWHMLEHDMPGRAETRLREAIDAALDAPASGARTTGHASAAARRLSHFLLTGQAVQDQESAAAKGPAHTPQQDLQRLLDGLDGPGAALAVLRGAAARDGVVRRLAQQFAPGLLARLVRQLLDAPAADGLLALADALSLAAPEDLVRRAVWEQLLAQVLQAPAPAPEAGVAAAMRVLAAHAGRDARHRGVHAQALLAALAGRQAGAHRLSGPRKPASAPAAAAAADAVRPAGSPDAALPTSPAVLLAAVPAALAAADATAIYGGWDGLVAAHASALREILRRHGPAAAAWRRIAMRFPLSILHDIATLLAPEAARRLGGLGASKHAGWRRAWLRAVTSALAPEGARPDGTGLEAQLASALAEAGVAAPRLMLDSITRRAAASASATDYLQLSLEDLAAGRPIDLDDLAGRAAGIYVERALLSGDPGGLAAHWASLREAHAGVLEALVRRIGAKSDAWTRVVGLFPVPLLERLYLQLAQAAPAPDLSWFDSFMRLAGPASGSEAESADVERSTDAMPSTPPPGRRNPAPATAPVSTSGDAHASSPAAAALWKALQRQLTPHGQPLGAKEDARAARLLVAVRSYAAGRRDPERFLEAVLGDLQRGLPIDLESIGKRLDAAGPPWRRAALNAPPAGQQADGPGIDRAEALPVPYSPTGTNASQYEGAAPRVVHPRRAAESGSEPAAAPPFEGPDGAGARDEAVDGQGRPSALAPIAGSLDRPSRYALGAVRVVRDEEPVRSGENVPAFLDAEQAAVQDGEASGRLAGPRHAGLDARRDERAAPRIAHPHPAGESGSGSETAPASPFKGPDGAGGRNERPDGHGSSAALGLIAGDQGEPSRHVTSIVRAARGEQPVLSGVEKPAVPDGEQAAAQDSRATAGRAGNAPLRHEARGSLGTRGAPEPTRAAGDGATAEAAFATGNSAAREQTPAAGAADGQAYSGPNGGQDPRAPVRDSAMTALPASIAVPVVAGMDGHAGRHALFAAAQARAARSSAPEAYLRQVLDDIEHARVVDLDALDLRFAPPAARRGEHVYTALPTPTPTPLPASTPPVVDAGRSDRPLLPSIAAARPEPGRHALGDVQAASRDKEPARGEADALTARKSKQAAVGEGEARAESAADVSPQHETRRALHTGEAPEHTRAARKDAAGEVPASGNSTGPAQTVPAGKADEPQGEPAGTPGPRAPARESAPTSPPAAIVKPAAPGRDIHAARHALFAAARARAARSSAPEAYLRQVQDDIEHARIVDLDALDLRFNRPAAGRPEHADPALPMSTSIAAPTTAPKQEHAVPDSRQAAAHEGEAPAGSAGPGQTPAPDAATGRTTGAPAGGPDPHAQTQEPTRTSPPPATVAPAATGRNDHTGRHALFAAARARAARSSAPEAYLRQVQDDIERARIVDLDALDLRFAPPVADPAGHAHPALPTPIRTPMQTSTSTSTPPVDAGVPGIPGRHLPVSTQLARPLPPRLEAALAAQPPALRAALLPLLYAGGDDPDTYPPALMRQVVAVVMGERQRGVLRHTHDLADLAMRIVPGLSAAAVEKQTWRFAFGWCFERSLAFDAPSFMHGLARELALGAGAEAVARLQTALHERLGVAPPHELSPEAAAGDAAPEEAPPAVEALRMGNAGQVLVAPYLPRLFAMVGLTEGPRFRDAAAAERAVHLLQFVVDGHGAAPEYLLGLNKVLCGLPLEAPIVHGIEPSPEEREAVDMMLRALIAHWKKIGNTTPDGLRQSFLQRPGAMHLKEDAWRLTVEQGPFDMLLDTLPWSFSIIKHPWMERAVHVTWR